MIKEAIQHLQEHFLKQQAPQPTGVDQPDDRKTYIMPDGTSKVVQGAPRPLDHVVKDVASFADACKHHKVRYVKFMNASIVGAVDRECREQVYLPLHHTNEFSLLNNLLSESGSQDGGVSARELVFKLNSDFRYCFMSSDERQAMIKKFGQLKVITAESGDRVHSRAQDTMGETIERQIAGDIESLPEEAIWLHPRIYDCPDVKDIQMPIQVYIEPNLVRKLWVLRVLQDSVDNAELEVRNVLKDKLTSALGDEIPVTL